MLEWVAPGGTMVVEAEVIKEEEQGTSQGVVGAQGTRVEQTQS